MSAHDSWLAGYSRDTHRQVFCDNPACSNHDGTTVTWETEYGAGWYTPEECWACGGDWLEDRPDEEEVEDDAAEDRYERHQNRED